MKVSKWIGRQSARLKQGVLYFTIITQIINVISLLKLAFDMDIFGMIALVPFLIIGTWFIGWLLDRMNIVSEDLRKNTEMAARIWSDADEKTTQFQCEVFSVLLSELTGTSLEDARLKMRGAHLRVKNKWLPEEERLKET
jgi:hypothetical protein